MAVTKYFPLSGNEIKYVEKQRKLLYFSQLCRNKRILQLLYLIFLFTFWKEFDHDPDHDFDGLFAPLKSLSFICSEQVEHLIFVFCNSVMITILNQVQFGEEKSYAFNFGN